MPKTESQVKTDMVKAVRKAGGYARRIEDQYAVGILDTILVPPRGVTLMAEVKLIRDNMFGPTPRQWEEMRRVTEAGARDCHAILIGWKNKLHYFATFDDLPVTGHKIDYRVCFAQGPEQSFPEALREFATRRFT